jgi:D-alanyl-lipoteichoic acid acyltransferase DltB (MBOAT superfamily)
MLFNSYVYIFIFLPVTLAGFFLIAGRVHRRVAVVWLVGASLFYYSWWNPVYVGLIVGSMLFNYAVGLQLESRSKAIKFRKGLLIFGIAVNLGLIGYFKYANFFIDNINVALETNFHLNKIILPLAISFFTFQQIAYLMDAYRRETREYNFIHYFLFVTFFPQLIAGPIVHHKEMIPQFVQQKIYKPSAKNFASGITIYAIGVFKKIALADEVAQYASPLFTVAEKGNQLITFFDAWAGALAYTLQIYFDFSGYTDMAIGSALMFGIRLPLNFNSPYKSLNIIDFWRRWHMTLSRFMKDYLYVPLGGNRVSTARMLFNLMVTMLLGGLWHGAGWTFVIWGALHGFYLVINHGWRILREKVFVQELTQSSFPGKAISVMLTMFAVTVGWVVFRAETIEGASRVLQGMLGVNGTEVPNVFANIHPVLTSLLHKLHINTVVGSGIVFTTKWTIILLMTAILFLPNSTQHVNKIFTNNKLSRKKLFANAALTCVMITWAVLAINRPSEFLYFQF